MAIQADLQASQFGVPFQAAYFRIVTASVNRQRYDGVKHSVMIDVAGYAAKPQNEDTKEIDFRRYHAPIDDIEWLEGESFLGKCYNWVMQQPDMVGAIGVYEESTLRMESES